jgi:hypothetical protein
MMGRFIVILLVVLATVMAVELYVLCGENHLCMGRPFISENDFKLLLGLFLNVTLGSIWYNAWRLWKLLSQEPVVQGRFPSKFHPFSLPVAVNTYRRDGVVKSTQYVVVYPGMNGMYLLFSVKDYFHLFQESSITVKGVLADESEYGLVSWNPRPFGCKLPSSFCYVLPGTAAIDIHVNQFIMSDHVPVLSDTYFAFDEIRLFKKSMSEVTFHELQADLARERFLAFAQGFHPKMGIGSILHQYGVIDDILTCVLCELCK